MANKVCKNKKCQKSLPEGYKHKYCESCRGEQAQGVKKGLKVFASTVGTAACLAVVVITKGKINPKK